MNKQIKIGDIGKDIITGFTGVAIGVSLHLHNCDTVGLNPQTVKDDGTPSTASWFDMPQVEVVQEGVLPYTPPTELGDVALGKKAKDMITGYSGIITAITYWMNGCIRVALQSPKLEKGVPVEDQYFALSQIELVPDKALGVVDEVNESARVRTGGPMKAPKSIKAPR